MSDIEILLLYRRAVASGDFTLRTGDCSGRCPSCPASRACSYLTTDTPWSVAWPNFTFRINIHTRLSTLRRKYPEYFI